MILISKLRKKFYKKVKGGKSLNLKTCSQSQQNITHLQFPIAFLLRMISSTNLLKRLYVTSKLYPLVTKKDLLIYHLPQSHYHYTAKKFNRVKTRQIGNHQSCQPAWKFLIIRQLLLQCFLYFQNWTYIIATWILRPFVENDNVIIPKTFHHQLLQEDIKCIR